MAPIHATDARRQAFAFAVVGALQVAGAAAVLLAARDESPTGDNRASTTGTRRSRLLGRRAPTVAVELDGGRAPTIAVDPDGGRASTVAVDPDGERAPTVAVGGTVGLGVVAAVAWAWSRRWALPFGLGGPEDAGLVDGLTVAFELAALVAAVVRRPLPVRPLLPLQLLAAVATVAVLAAPSTAEHGGHGHAGTAATAACAAESGHDHGAATTPADEATDPAGTATGHTNGDGGSTPAGSGGECGAACPEAGIDGPPVTDPPLDFPGERLTPERAAALHDLAAASEPLPCGAVAAAAGHGHGADEQSESPLDPADQARFDTQWAAAEAAATRLATLDAAAAAGYVQASPQNPGVGTHWIDWTLVDAPFDPARPSMLLFDERPSRTPRLVGFSYWNRSAPSSPDGFAGPNDVWHRHTGLCFVEGWLFQEGVPSADRCAGDWLNGNDLWMLHAWVVPGLPNPAGRFAGRHDAVCPGDNERVADALTCDPVGN